MPHLVRPFGNETISNAISRLESVHSFLVLCAASASPPVETRDWGTRFKRVTVPLNQPGRPEDIEKSEEKLAEVINMAATLERLLGALTWFAQSERFRGAVVAECHPSTSDTEAGNDLVLQLKDQIVARIEVFDIVSSTADSNDKEPSTLIKLRCDLTVNPGATSYWMVTSTEFAGYISRASRKWHKKHFRYIATEAGDDAKTVLLEIISR